jgi:hypothetical protein
VTGQRCSTGPRYDKIGLAEAKKMSRGWPVPDFKEASMTIHSIANGATAVAFAGVMIVALGSPAQSLTMKECSAKYQAAKDAGTLNGQKWNEFRKSQCGADAQAAPTSNPASTAPATTSTASPAKAEPAGSAVYPTAVAPKYEKESPGKARLHTCLDQYNANKASNGNGGLKWIQKGGGYYSECNKQLKG